MIGSSVTSGGDDVGARFSSSARTLINLWDKFPAFKLDVWIAPFSNLTVSSFCRP
jgi:hypothetical protein